MAKGTVVSINVTSTGGSPMKAIQEARAVEGKGIEGDRYFLKTGTYSKTDKPDRQITLIEAEAVEAAGRDYEIEIAAGKIRRNLVTRGIALNHLVGREFTVGGARLRGLRLCEPCDHMEGLSGARGIREALVHRGGLRCEVLKGGTIRAGDAISDE